MTTAVIEIDLTSTRTLLGEALQLCRELDGVGVMSTNNTRRADIRKDLAYLADTLFRASGEVRSVYHVINGRRDPLEMS